jgi:hypothetical protein
MQGWDDGDETWDPRDKSRTTASARRRLPFLHVVTDRYPLDGPAGRVQELDRIAQASAHVVSTSRLDNRHWSIRARGRPGISVDGPTGHRVVRYAV